jgi:hypothetical protein
MKFGKSVSLLAGPILGAGLMQSQAHAQSQYQIVFGVEGLKAPKENQVGAKSCLEIRDSSDNKGDGIYAINPTGA